MVHQDIRIVTVYSHGPFRETLAMVCRCCLVAAGCLILTGMAGCGMPSSDNAPGQESRANIAGSNNDTSSRNLGQGNRMPGLTSDVTQGSRTDSSSQENRLPTPLDGKTDERKQPPIPDTVAKDLRSSDAEIRMRALDHWTETDTTASLDPVLEVLEEEKNEAVQAKATAIIEQRWAAEEAESAQETW